MTPEKVKRIREKLGMSFDEFAVAVGASPRAVRYWESGEKKMRRIYARQIKALQVSNQVAAKR